MFGLFVSWVIKMLYNGSDSKELPVMQETQFWSLCWEDPLERELVTHSTILAGESHEQRSLVAYSP